MYLCTLKLQLIDNCICIPKCVYIEVHKKIFRNLPIEHMTNHLMFKFTLY